ncbi:MAG: hypothetical protein Kow0058_14470 [Roseovarius sp.]
MRLPVLLCATIWSAGPAAAADMADCDYQASFYGSTGTIQVRGGKPVGYFTPRYTASSVGMNGDTIFIDKATLSNVRTGKTQDGKWAIQGDWPG